MPDAPTAAVIAPITLLRLHNPVLTRRLRFSMAHSGGAAGGDVTAAGAASGGSAARGSGGGAYVHTFWSSGNAILMGGDENSAKHGASASGQGGPSTADSGEGGAMDTDDHEKPKGEDAFDDGALVGGSAEIDSAVRRAKGDGRGARHWLVAAYFSSMSETRSPMMLAHESTLLAAPAAPGALRPPMVAELLMLLAARSVRFHCLVCPSEAAGKKRAREDGEGERPPDDVILLGADLLSDTATSHDDPTGTSVFVNFTSRVSTNDLALLNGVRAAINSAASIATSRDESRTLIGEWEASLGTGEDPQGLLLELLRAERPPIDFSSVPSTARLHVVDGVVGDETLLPLLTMPFWTGDAAAGAIDAADTMGAAQPTDMLEDDDAADGIDTKRRRVASTEDGDGA